MVARKLALEIARHRHCLSTFVRGALDSEPVGGSHFHCLCEDRVIDDRSLENHVL